ncbi:MAG: type III pantothenate kinase [Candidatus Promineifilaceae bacterium]
MSLFTQRAMLQSADMLLAIDIGNTNVTLGLWDGTDWLTQWRLRTVHEKTVDEYWSAVRSLLKDTGNRENVDRVILASVVPPLTATFAELSRRYLKLDATQVNSETDTGIVIKTDNPREVGADRIVDAVAAIAQYGGPAIVIDMGTATTFDVVSAESELLGVVIAPGLRLAGDALAARAAQLSRVALQAPPQVLGKNTIHAVQSGLIFGYVSLVEGVVQRLSAEVGIKPVVIGTGGLINLIIPHTDLIDHVDPWLTLTGLRLISDRNT